MLQYQTNIPSVYYRNEFNILKSPHPRFGVLFLYCSHWYNFTFTDTDPRGGKTSLFYTPPHIFRLSGPLKQKKHFSPPFFCIRKKLKKLNKSTDRIRLRRRVRGGNSQWGVFWKRSLSIPGVRHFIPFRPIRRTFALVLRWQVQIWPLRCRNLNLPFWQARVDFVMRLWICNPDFFCPSTVKGHPLWW